MNTVRTVQRLVVTFGISLFLPAVALAQTGTIAGVVRDTSGAVLPGVTVEAASPALIEKARTVVSDGQGVYRIVDLRPGTYQVTFTLPGFNQLRREGVELTAGFTATVNAELAIGAVEETVTVSGAAPLVDTQAVVQQQTLSRQTLDAIPLPGRTGNYASVLLGAVQARANQDVGGIQGETAGGFAIHGGRNDDFNVSQDGLILSSFSASANFSFNPHSNQEVVLETGGRSAESVSAGVRFNLVPKDGGNTFSGGVSTSYSPADLQADNLSDEVRARGLTSAPSLRRHYDAGGSLGGPIRRDRVWFFTAHRRWGASRYIPGNFYNKNNDTPVGADPVYLVTLYEPDLDRPAFTDDFYQDHTLRLTWQASQKDKVAVSYTVQNNCSCPQDAGLRTGIQAPEATGNHYYQPNYYSTVSWSRPATNRLLFEGGVGFLAGGINGKRLPETRPNAISIIEQSINREYGSRARGPGLAGSYSTMGIVNQHHERLAVSYITGSHSFKTGVNFSRFSQSHRSTNNFEQHHGARKYFFRNGVPNAVAIWATPFGQASESRKVAAFVQDQWTIARFTLDLGLRYDDFNAWILAERFPAGHFVPERIFPEVRDSPDWKLVNPRLGVAYDLFGNGRTALKASLGRYAIGTSGHGYNAVNRPIDNQAASATRTWNDANRNYVPDCVLGPSVPGANGECGPLSDVGFGQVREGTTRWADDALTQYANNWQGSASVQHEVLPGLALNVSYFRTWYGHLNVTDNRALTAADFDPFCVTVPVDSRLPGSGNQLCGFYDLNPAKFGRVDNLITQASNFGRHSEVYNGFDAALTGRLSNGATLAGGVSTGRTVVDTCYAKDNPAVSAPGFVAGSPRTEEFCKVTTPFEGQTQMKFLVVYPLPWDLRVSGTYQNLPGIPITASLVVPNAQVAPSLGRNLGACRGAAVCNSNVTVELIPPGTMFEDRLQQVDVRFTRMFRLRDVRLEGNFDLYNLFNASSVLTQNLRYGAQWLNATQVLAGRVVKFGAQLSF